MNDLYHFFQPMKDSLKHLWQQHNNDIKHIHNICSGEKYTAVTMENGNTGVCANLNIIVPPVWEIASPDFNAIPDRILVNAFLNAVNSYNFKEDGLGDLAEVVDFSGYKKIVMIGFFESLSQRLAKKGVNPTIFDKLITDNPTITNIQEMLPAIASCDAMILTATTISNNTFTEIYNTAKAHCHIYILGPSAILHQDMFQFPKIAAIFGSIFLPEGKDELLTLIKAGHGTKSFLHLLKKVYIINK
ncbi:MAG: hypothetical protein CVU05_13905, partial [Bacteroidetes bacterium HGW-Bacteroidetes-21]